ncbi:MAG: peptidoglycan-binding protein LysM [Myxococcaceae bacterium]
MKRLLLALVLSSTPPAPETVVRPKETLADVALRTLGSASAASELRAINHLDSNAVAAGTQLLLPGPERELALSALASAKSAVHQAKPGAARNEASERTAEAERLLSTGRYAEAAAQADSAWKLLSQRVEDPSRFAIQVAPDGTTRVHVDSGIPVRVEAEGRTRAVSPGETVMVHKGEAPGIPTGQLDTPTASSLEAPVLLAPAANLRLVLDSKGKGVGPLRLSWRSVPRARGYLVELKGPTSQVLRTTRAEASFPSALTGSYRWSVRALGVEGELGPASERQLELSTGNIKLEVQTPDWK